MAEKIASYLRHDISIADLVSWAEGAMMDGEFDESEVAPISDVVSRLGVADARAFGLTWEDASDCCACLVTRPTLISWRRNGHAALMSGQIVFSSGWRTLRLNSARRSLRSCCNAEMVLSICRKWSLANCFT